MKCKLSELECLDCIYYFDCDMIHQYIRLRKNYEKDRYKCYDYIDLMEMEKQHTDLGD